MQPLWLRGPGRGALAPKWLRLLAPVSLGDEQCFTLDRCRGGRVEAKSFELAATRAAIRSQRRALEGRGRTDGRCP